MVQLLCIFVSFEFVRYLRQHCFGWEASTAKADHNSKKQSDKDNLAHKKLNAMLQRMREREAMIEWEAARQAERARQEAEQARETDIVLC